MKYDVFIVSAKADLDAADAIARRLRTLKFKVRFDKKREHVTATPTDIKNINDSRSVLVLWSKEACDSERPDSNWVYALAHQARSRNGVLVEAGLDSTEPDEPFDDGHRYLLSGLGPRRIVKPFLELADELGKRGGRSGLSDWLGLKASDKAGKDAWKAAHPDDPLALVGKAKPAAKPAKPTPKAKASASPVIGAAPKLTMSPPAASSQQRARAEEADARSNIILLAISLGIAIMFLTAYFMRSGPAESTPIGNARISSSLICPDGQRLVCPTPILEPGPIIDDTSED